MVVNGGQGGTVEIDQPDACARVLAFFMMKIVAVLILISATLVCGHRWRVPSTTTVRATVSALSIFPGGVTTDRSLRALV
jgi:hypothetical protein